MTTKAKKDYSKGKIYKIEPICEHEEGEIYIGSTTKQYLSQRMVRHRKDYLSRNHHRMTSFILFDKYGIDNCNIILLESVNAKDYNELVARESYYIKSLKCVNKVVPLRTRKEYYNDNREIILIKEKEYRKDNKEKVEARVKEYRKIKYNCECGSICSRYMKSSHFKSIKHQEFIKQNYDKDLEIVRYTPDKEDKYDCECGSVCSLTKKARHFKSIKHQNYLKQLDTVN